MGTVRPPFQQVYHPLYDSSQPYELNRQRTAQDPSEMNLYGPTAQIYWEQWCSTEDTIFSESTNTTGPNLYPQAQQAPFHFAYGPDVSTEWASPSTEFTSAESPTESSASTQTDKRRHNMSQTTPRRTPTRRNPKPERIKEKPKIQGKGKAAAKAELSFTRPKELNEYIKQVHDRSRIASHKFRMKQREDAKRLDADTKEIERINSGLSNQVSELTAEVYDLRMKLLQHTDCNCHLIQKYIANEAHQYVQDWHNGKQIHATLPVYPYPQQN
ncbi:hypothetical protein FANTH_14739 [Fusarium anthophilum]|uniref:BZIP domain-containing protein n=1 Tax=Fusarium anthophilum TaxID=48485 RepID=A0A8H4YGT4_9HYPO|nr:hypothetical protein FANTH_14739 [Fusarium anthophilum]